MGSWWTVISDFFAMVTSGFNLGTKLAPTEKMKEDKAERQKKRLTADEYGKQLKALRRWMIWHPKQSVDALVNLKCDIYDADDIQDFRIALYEMFPKRKHIVQ